MKHMYPVQHRKYPSLKMLVILLLFLASQIAGVLHLVEHSIEGDNDGCEICSAIAHAGTATLPEPVAFVLPAESVQESADICAVLFFASFSGAYTSRAPPASA